MTAEQNIERKPLSVSAAMALAKGALEQVTITLVGEVSEVSNKPGYKAVYFSVKDEAATMPCMMWMNRYHSANVELKVGALVQRKVYAVCTKRAYELRCVFTFPCW